MITLSPMTESDYRAFLDKFIPVYAADMVEAGNWTEMESLERSRQAMDRFLPEGIKTPGQFIYNLMSETGEKVGLLWYGRQADWPAEAFIFEFEIYELYRRRGYARQALAALEIQARRQEFKRLALNVFASNTAARQLYLKSGFVESVHKFGIETNVNMAREL